MQDKSFSPKKSLILLLLPIFSFHLGLSSVQARTGGGDKEGISYYRDYDGDGFGNPRESVAKPIDGYVKNDDDCNDSDARLNPTTVWYKDADGDWYSDGTSKKQCERPKNYKLARELTAISADCDDGNAAINPATVWYKDADGDGYSDGASEGPQCERPKNYKPAKKLRATSGDCNDGNPVLNPATLWYKDADGDGYSDGASKKQCERPKNYKLARELRATSGDCDDGDAIINPATLWYKDADNDGYSDGKSKRQCRNPGADYHLRTELTATGGDCNDSNALFNPATLWYKDADGDKYSDGKSKKQCNRPPNYKLARELRATRGDCDDGNAAINSATIWYKDADNDGYSDGVSKGPQCERPKNYKVATELTAIIADCDDDSTAINPATIWYKDVDNDGYSDGASKGPQCERPKNYKVATELTATSGDCDEGNPAINPATIWYKDADGDGYSDGTSKKQCRRPKNYKLARELTAIKGDCDDEIAIINPTTVWYKDADGDGYSDGTSKKQCQRPTDYKLARELTAASGDCDDGNAAINPATIWYKDVDNDRYSDGTAKKQCNHPKNYKLARELTATSGDCDDEDAVLNPATVWYTNNDGDEYYRISKEQCERLANHYLASEFTAPTGDCNDNDPKVYPGAEEVCDCQDNDCDRARDEEISFVNYCYDHDGDGKGNPSDRLGSICETPNGKFCNNTFSSGHSISYILEKIPEKYVPNCSDLDDSNSHR